MSSPGLPSLFAIVCMLAPVAVPLLKLAWARWLNAAPLGFAVLALITVGSQIHSATSAMGSMGEEPGGRAAREMVRSSGPSFSPATGAYIAILCAMYLATRALNNS